MENRERKISINLYLNEQEFDLLNAKVRHSGLPNRSVYLRQLILNGCLSCRLFALKTSKLATLQHG